MDYLSISLSIFMHTHIYMLYMYIYFYMLTHINNIYTFNYLYNVHICSLTINNSKNYMKNIYTPNIYIHTYMYIYIYKLAIIFSHFKGCLFILFMGSIVVQKL